MTEEPGGFHAALKGSLDLPGSEALLGRIHQVDDLQPDVQRNMAGLENSPHPDSKLLPASVAFIEPWAGRPTTQFAEPIDLATMMTDRAVGPEPRLDISESGVFVLEMFGGQVGLHSG
jgi:hypothetical protein